MTLRTVLAALAASLVLVSFTARDGWAGSPTDQLRTNVDRVLKVVGDTSMKAPDHARDRRAQVRRIAEDFFAFDETAKRALGRHWQARTPAEQKEFVALFSDLLERSYLTKIELYGGEKIQYVGEMVDGGVNWISCMMPHGSRSEYVENVLLYGEEVIAKVRG